MDMEDARRTMGDGGDGCGEDGGENNGFGSLTVLLCCFLLFLLLLVAVSVCVLFGPSEGRAGGGGREPGRGTGRGILIY